MIRDQLTERETDILRSMIGGASNREIAHHLVLSVETVRWYVKQIYSKLGVHTRQDAIAHARVLIPETTPAPPTSRHNLPHQSTAFVGRERELVELGDLLQQPDTRLITLLAPGGMGKTRLALELAHRTLANFADGAFFIPLAPLSSAETILSALADNIGYRFIGDDDRTPREQVLDYLSRKQLLLIMDNYEHLLAGTSMIADVLSVAPRVRIIVTSRERLHLSGETIYNVGGLQYADSDTITDTAAGQLLIKQIQLIQPHFSPNQEDRGAILRICQLTDGMPLALLLSASWGDVLSLTEIADEISRSIDFLASDTRDMPDRHRSIRAVVQPTWIHLPPAERELFMILSVFRGGCDREAIEAITGASLRTLQSLANKSLMWRDADGRYDQHEILRQFAQEQLRATDRYDDVRSRHARYYMALLRDLEPDIKGRDQFKALNAIERNLENIRVAYQWIEKTHLVTLVNDSVDTLYWFSVLRSDIAICDELLHRILSFLQADPAFRPVWCRVFVRYQRLKGANVEAQPEVNECLELARTNADLKEQAFCLHTLGSIARREHDYQQAIIYYEEALQLYQSFNDDFHCAWVLNSLARCRLFNGEFATYIAYNKTSLEYARKCGDKIGMANALNELGFQASENGELANAEAYHYEAMKLRREMNNYVGVSWSLASLGVLAFYGGNIAQCLVFMQEALEIAIDISHRESIAHARAYIALAEVIQGHFASAKEHLAKVPPAMNPSTISAVYLTQASLAYESGEYAEAKAQAGKLFHKLLTANLHTMVGSILPLAIVLTTHDGDYDTASMLIGLKDASTTGICSWTKHWQPFKGIDQRLCEKVGESAFHNLYAQGKSWAYPDAIQKLCETYYQGA